MTHIVFSNYEWDNWTLFHNVIFDGPNKLILVREGLRTLDIKRDVYSAWKEYLVVLGLLGLHPENAGFLQAIRAIGGDPTVGAAQIGSTFFLTNGWKIKPVPGNYRLIVNGNLFSEDGSDPFVPSDIIFGQPNNITISLNTSNIVDLINAGFGVTQTTWLEELHKIHGLRLGTDLVVTPTARTAGVDIVQTITTLGGDTDPVTISRNP